MKPATIARALRAARPTLLASALLLAATDCHAATAKTHGGVGSDEVKRAKAMLVNDRITLKELPLSADRVGPVTLKRIDVYAPGARIHVIDEQGSHDIPRSDWLHFVADKSIPGSPRMSVSMSADGAHAEGFLLSDDGHTYALNAERRLGRLDFTLNPTGKDAQGNKTRFACADDLYDGLLNRGAPEPVRLPFETDAVDATTAATRTATLAVDTDNEFMQQKFSNNTTNASNYIAALIAGLNVIYERDLDLTMVQGDTTLRVSTVTDPYNDPGTNTLDQLDEFGEYWSANQGTVVRAFATQLSGKSPSTSFSQGIAWILANQNYCNQKGATFGGCTDGTCTFGHYSIFQVFKAPNSAASADVGVVAHEIGHNLGAYHSHCSSSVTGAGPASSNTIDTCYNQESGQGCYGGMTTTCPAATTINGVNGVQGTLMSYCDPFLSGLSCSSSNVFATKHADFLKTNITANVTAGCFQNATSPNQTPTVTSPGSIAVIEDTATNINGITFGDVDAGGGSLTATFTVAAGSFNSPSCSGIAVGGTAAARVLMGTLANLNLCVGAAATNLKYTPALNSTTNLTLSIQINDNGNSGSGGAKTASSSTTLTLSAVNDAPTLSLPASYTMATPTPLTGISVADVDSGASNVVLTLSVGSGTLTASSGGGITASGSGTATLTLTGPIASLSTYLGATPPSFNPGSATTLNATLSDQGATGSGGTRTANATAPIAQSVNIFADGFE